MTEEELLGQPDEAYMNAGQLAYFQRLLLEQRQALQDRISEEFESLKNHEVNSDPADIGSTEEARQWQLRVLEREKKLLDKIDEALERLARGDYGWCAETGEAIGLKRLLLRPTASLSVEAKERQEMKERHRQKTR
ncbi:RNA polymerase-binding protein DksA [Pseudomonas sp. 148P]|uniref:RNA polymerase-binding transcription factor DksA n=1 Tax=Pseudomonas ulcerans TaxID=3115852 RepID=A0ABU7HNR0_9PSED|nr:MULTISPECIES: RNA polymerase-binding protein DksA [unclassified Pseudomonas]MEE1923673.1 RNA polymerase-binding protein DksA [Pseudomonas sp. 147P]MEE1933171.1 RNA polymerase-binding protein DksA [Pseudomonas sp. 148P]